MSENKDVFHQIKRILVECTILLLTLIGAIELVTQKLAGLWM
jgi:hypothetical protein